MNTSKQQETGAVDRGCSVKRVFLRRNPFISKVLACNYIKKETAIQVFAGDF